MTKIENLLGVECPYESKGKEMALAIFKESPENQKKILASIKKNMIAQIEVYKNEINS